MTIQPEARARLLGGFLLLALGAWILHTFLGFLFWGLVLALTTWPVYRRLKDWLDVRNQHAWLAAHDEQTVIGFIHRHWRVHLGFGKWPFSNRR